MSIVDDFAAIEYDGVAAYVEQDGSVKMIGANRAVVELGPEEARILAADLLDAAARAGLPICDGGDHQSA